MITVLFFAQLREQLNCERVLVALPATNTLLGLREQLVAQNPDWFRFLTSDSLLFSVNHTLVKASHPLQDGDEVAFFPPVTGG